MMDLDLATDPKLITQLGIRIPVDLHRQIKRAALDQDLTIQEFVIRGIEDRLRASRQPAISGKNKGKK